MSIYLTNSPAKFHPDPFYFLKAFFEDGHSKKMNKMMNMIMSIALRDQFLNQFLIKDKVSES